MDNETAVEEVNGVKTESPAIVETPKLGLVAKLARVMGGLSWIEKRGRNTFFNYDYATEADILDAVRDKLAAEGVFVLTSVQLLERIKIGENKYGNSEYLTRVETTHTITDGESSLVVKSIGEGTDTSDKGVYKAITGAMKYFVSKNFFISAGDDPEKDDEKENKKEDQSPSNGKGRTPANPPPQQPPPNGNGSVEDLVLKIESKTGPKKDGSTYTRFGIETQNNGFFTTFDPEKAKIADDARKNGRAVSITYKANGRWKDLESIAIATKAPSIKIDEDTLPF